MSYEELIVPSRDLYPLSVRIFDTSNPKGVIKFIHGMEEHQSRYEEFAEYLSKRGYIVVTADLRGHGKNAKKLSHIANKDGHKLLIEDERVIREYIDSKWPELPKYLFAHSMGTIIARNLLQLDSSKYEKVALSGYPNTPGIAPIGVALAATIKLFKGPEGYSKTLTNASVGQFSKAVKNAKTPLDWLSYNEENVQKYIKDPLCGEEFTVGSYCALLHLTNDMHKVGRFKDVKKDLPILLISGEDDPCTGGEKGRQDSLKVLSKAGFDKVEVVTIKHNRHEILNEDSKIETMKTIGDFFDK